jgi:molybdopterin synthase catalytic subunit
MIKKIDLLKSLKESLNTEERAMPVYARHLGSTIFFSGFSKDMQEKIKDTLLTLKAESERHEQIFKALIEKVEKSQKDVY